MVSTRSLVDGSEVVAVEGPPPACGVRRLRIMIAGVGLVKWRTGGTGCLPPV